jgi:triosephosphate isomerase
MKTHLVVANLKMQWRTREDASAYAHVLTKQWSGSAPSTHLVICPPAIYIQQLREALPEDIFLGAQDASHEVIGAYTGEISASMLQDIGANYVIVGHSERRQYFGESDTLIAQKAQRVMSQGMTAVWCVGETRAERDQGRTLEVLQEQITPMLQEGEYFGEHVVIAYEPRWAIGTGEIPSTEDIVQAVAGIRATLLLSGDERVQAVRILYGGSVTPENFNQVCVQTGLDGVLVGKESLSPSSLMDMYKQMEDLHV